jgi:hypothetical protein
MAEGVEEVAAFETMIQNSGLCRINIAASAAHTNNSCTKFDGPDFFNTLGYKQTFGAERPMSVLGPITDIGASCSDTAKSHIAVAARPLCAGAPPFAFTSQRDIRRVP